MTTTSSLQSDDDSTETTLVRSDAGTPAPSTRSAERVVECLKAYGVQWVFGVPGAKIDPVYDALIDDGPEVIVVRHEQNAAFMAAAVGRLSGQPGVVLVTSGPGTSNLATGLLTATTEGDPVVALCGAVPRADRLKRTHQTMDAVGMLSAVTKSAGEVSVADNVPEAIANAFREATQEPKGAAAVVLPYDVLTDSTTVSMTQPHWVPQLGAAPSKSVQRAAALLKDAQFPVILAGARSGSDQAVAALHRLLGVAGLPVVETFQAAGVISHELEEHYLGRVGLFRNQPGDILLHKADVILTVGYDFVEYEPSKWNKDHLRVIIHLDELAADLDDYYRPTVELRGDVAETLDALARQINGLSMPVAAAAEVAEQRACLAHADQPTGRRDESEGVHPADLTLMMRELLPDDTTVLCDVGSHYIYMARHFRTYHPRTLLFSNGQQTLGVALPWAIAATLVRPGTPVVSVSGDGGFLYSAMELETAVRLGSTFTHIIFNDGTYDMVAFQQMGKYGRTSGVQLGDYDAVAYAESFGAHGHRVTHLDDFAGILAQALAEPGPSIIDVHVDYRNNRDDLMADLESDVLQ
ncbi:acetolactate synthase AlsS [Cryobacterium sp. TMT2-18-3]|uniref:acetolactate synthase AlsS n=1 Tax=unclassified Cryobacterium TaxID=2649013 RepID=UPI00106D17D8|nr:MULTISPECIES: acetolactate synthase AlsS [unclassified Cryobacterium]TFC28542.1 acetolactate synthase AlsS [Cryobacterium sp. TMT2-18-2]TFC36964.1 acetolactate synthase AlsS [Cryobacterium sp. TMT2-42-4]TFC64159.1 acetolactate synthase AlsS [Cryobacterium sp. TMT2-18-3]TFC64765.1 acetolactate synthase AlsS [Cryobacterium sp. TMT2-15-1]